MKQTIKMYFGVILLSSVLAALFLSFIFDINGKWFAVLMLPSLAIAIAWVYRYKKLEKNIVEQFGIICTRYSNPTPIKTMLTAILENGYDIADISNLDMMSYDLNHSCEYLANNNAIKLLKTKNQNVQISIKGHSASDVLPECDGVKLIKTQKRLTEHKNLITMNDGKMFLWYEPYHEIKNSKHLFIDGAFLIEINSQAADNLKKEFAS